MGQGKPQHDQDLWPSSYGGVHIHLDQMKKKDLQTSIIIGHGGDADDQDRHEFPSVSSSPFASSSSIGHDDDDSRISNGSSSSIDDIDGDDASSTITCSTSSNSSTGALYDLSEIMAQLPIKKGLSQYYDGKSDSFSCLSSVTSLEDLAKKESPYCTRKKKKNTAVAYRLFTLPRPVISKKNSKGISLSTSNSLRRSFINGGNCSRPPQIPLHKGFNGG